MVRSSLLWLKHLLYAVAVLALLGCLVEIALRVHDSATGQITRRDLYDRGMVCKSWFCHHTLKPSHAYSVKNPDTLERVRVELNSLGLRGPEPAVPTPAGTFRILCLGDDTTFAPQVPLEETFCARLEQELQARAGRRVEVINAGVPDFCPLLSYLQYRHQLSALQPDLIIVHFDMSDVGDDYQYRRHLVADAAGAPVSCEHPALEMSKRGGPTNESPLLLPQWAKQRFQCFLAEKSKAEDSRSIDSPRGRYLWLEDQPPDWTVYIEHTLAPIGQLAELVRPGGTEVIVAVSPAPWQVSANASNGQGVRARAGVPAEALFRSRRPFEILEEFCRVHRLGFCDASPVFQHAPQSEGLYLENVAALSTEGHALYARQLAESVLRQVRALSPSGGGGPAGSPASDPFVAPQARLPGR